MGNDDDVRRDWSGFLKAAAAFLLGTGFVLWVFGPTWIGLLVAFILVLAAFTLRSVWPGGSRKELMSGEFECPHCASLQTDQVERMAPDGQEYSVMHCFACDRDFQLDADQLESSGQHVS